MSPNPRVNDNCCLLKNTLRTIAQARNAPPPIIDARDPHVVRDIKLADAVLLAGVFVPGFTGCGMVGDAAGTMVGMML